MAAPGQAGVLLALLVQGMAAAQVAEEPADPAAQVAEETTESAAPAAPAPTFALSGAVALTERGDAVGEAGEVVVYYRPKTPVELQPPAEPLIMATEGKRFSPRVLPLVVGSTVEFPNRDPILHNVFSLSRNNSFDLGLFGPDRSESHQFETLGLVRVYCNVHQSMVAHVLVLDTPFFVTTGEDGRFELDALPAGPGTLYAWHERARHVFTQAMTLPLEEPVEIGLELNQRQVPSHRNKFGKSYRRTGNRRERY